MIKLNPFSFGVVFFVLFFFGCSSSKSSPVISVNPQSDINLPATEINTEESSHSILGTWTLSVNPETLEATVKQNRTLNAHHNVTGMIPDPLITINSWDPIEEIVDVDIQIHNPTWISIYDVRLIIYTDDAGHELLNDDNWTPLWDIPGGRIANPFKAYARNEPNRIFSGENWHQENFQIKCPNSNFNVQFAIDVSYPGNCEEPYAYENFTQGSLYEDVGSYTQVTVDVLDWQNDVSDVYLHCPEITDEQLSEFEYSGANEWSISLFNNRGAGAGDYTGYLISKSLNSGTLALYDRVNIVIFPAGLHGWALTWDGLSIGHCDQIAVDDLGNSYIVGGCLNWDDDADLDPTPNEDIHESESDLVQTFLCKLGPDGEYLWGRIWTGGKKIFTGGIYRGIAVDNSGNVYVTSRFDDDESVDFDPGPTEDRHFSIGQTDIFLSKFDTNGNYQWVRTWGGEASDAGMEVDVDSLGNIYVTGVFRYQADFDPGPEVDNHEASLHGTDIFLSKFDSNGIYEWARTWESGHEMMDWNDSHGIATDSADHIYVSGWFKGTIDLDPTNEIDEHTSNGNHDIFLSKFDSSGNFDWAHTWGSYDYDQSRGVTSDSFNNVYVTGLFNYTVDFDPGPGIQEYTALGGGDIFVSKFQPDGEFEWARTWGSVNGQYWDMGYALSTDDLSNVYVSGYFCGIADFDPGPGEDWHNSGYAGHSNAFISKFDSVGNYEWARSWGTSHILNVGYGNGVDSDSNVYVGGYIGYGEADFKPGPGEDIRDGNCAYLVKFLPDGYWE